MNPKQYFDFLVRAIQNGLSTLCGGKPGIGKTGIGRQAARYLSMDTVVTNFATIDSTMGAGLPWLSAGAEFAEFKPYGDVWRVLHAERPTVWQWEEVGQASHAVQASMRPWLLDRENNGRRLPDHVIIIGNTNDKMHKSGSNGVIEPVKTGFSALVSLEVDLECSLEWGASAGIHPDILYFWRVSPEALHEEALSADLELHANPRGWEHASSFLKTFDDNNISTKDLLMIMESTIGKRYAPDFVQFRRNREAVGDLLGMLKGSIDFNLPDGIGGRFAACAGVSFYIRKYPELWPGAINYALSLKTFGFADDAALLLRDCLRANKDLRATPEFINLATGKHAGLVA